MGGEGRGGTSPKLHDEEGLASHPIHVPCTHLKLVVKVPVSTSGNVIHSECFVPGCCDHTVVVVGECTRTHNIDMTTERRRIGHNWVL